MIQVTYNQLLMAVSIGALVAGAVAAYYAIIAYRLKAGIEVRGSFGWCSSIQAEDTWIRTVTLENLKDRAVVIFEILVELDRGYFVQIEDFESDPLILKPFEVFHREYDPVDFYSTNMWRMRLNHLVGAREVRNRLVLSTSHGRYNVSAYVRRWSSIIDVFTNSLHAHIVPIRATYEGKSFGSRARYVIDLTQRGGHRDIVPLYPNETVRYRKIEFDAESLRSKEAVEAHLRQNAAGSGLEIQDLKVVDLDAWRRQELETHKEFNATKVTRRSWFTFHVLGPLFTRWRDRRMRQRNRKRAREREEAKRLAAAKPESEQPSQ